MTNRFGPNTFPAHNSVIYASEVQVEYILRTLFAPIIDHAASTVEVKEVAEQRFVNEVNAKLAGSVFEAGCSNWYINSAGRNSASWPGKAASFWRATMLPHWSDFTYSGNESTWFVRRLCRSIKGILLSKWGALGILLGAFVVRWKQALPIGVKADYLENMVRSVLSAMGLSKEWKLSL